jgi:hypothetical protein
LVIRNSIPRLRSVTFKDGRAPLRIFRPAESSNLRDSFLDNATDCAAHRHAMAGYVIIAWGPDGGTSVACKTGGNPVPILMLPEFTKACVEDWVYSKD